MQKHLKICGTLTVLSYQSNLETFHLRQLSTSFQDFLKTKYFLVHKYSPNMSIVTDIKEIVEKIKNLKYFFTSKIIYFKFQSCFMDLNAMTVMKLIINKIQEEQKTQENDIRRQRRQKIGFHICKGIKTDIKNAIENFQNKNQQYLRFVHTIIGNYSSNNNEISKSLQKTENVINVDTLQFIKTKYRSWDNNVYNVDKLRKIILINSSVTLPQQIIVNPLEENNQEMLNSQVVNAYPNLKYLKVRNKYCLYEDLHFSDCPNQTSIAKNLECVSLKYSKERLGFEVIENIRNLCENAKILKITCKLQTSCVNPFLEAKRCFDEARIVKSLLQANSENNAGEVLVKYKKINNKEEIYLYRYIENLQN